MRSNYSIREQNMLCCFQFDEDAAELYLRGSQRNEPKAFEMACRWTDYIGPSIKLLLSFPSALHEQQPNNPHLRPIEIVNQELLEFFKDRHFYMYFPNNTTNHKRSA